MRGLLEGRDWAMWELGRKMCEGEDRFGEEAWNVLDPAKHNPNTVRVAMWTHLKVPEWVRQAERLSHSHHVTVASLEPEAQARLLRQAADGGWPVTALREEVRALKGREEAPRRRCDRCGKEHTCVDLQ